MEGGLPALGDQWHPAIHENLVVWEDVRDPNNPDIYMKIDGESPPTSPPDFIEGDAAEEFRQRVLDLLEAIGCSCCG